MAKIASVAGRENRFVLSLSRGEQELANGTRRDLVPVTWFDDPIAELADRFCEPSAPVQTVTPTIGETLDVIEVALTDFSQEPYVPFYVVPFQWMEADECESEHDCYACCRVFHDPTGNEWESIDGVGFALLPEQGTLYVRQRDMLRVVGGLFAEDVHRDAMRFATDGVLPEYRHSMKEFDADELMAVKESFMAMYMDE